MDSSRKEAISNKKPTYKTGLPCKHGHFSERSTTSGNCIECYRTIHKDTRLGYEVNKNKAAMSNATNKFQKWTIKDINIACQKDSKGNYIKTREQVANLIGRSIKSVEKCRMRQRIELAKKCKFMELGV